MDKTSMTSISRSLLVSALALASAALAVLGPPAPRAAHAACTIPTRSLTPTPGSTECDFAMSPEIKGRVVTGGGTPVPGARVAILAAGCGTAVAGADGGFVLRCGFAAWPCTCLPFQAEARGFMPWRESFSLGALISYSREPLATVAVDLRPAAATLYLPELMRTYATGPTHVTGLARD